MRRNGQINQLGACNPVLRGDMSAWSLPFHSPRLITGQEIQSSITSPGSEFGGRASEVSSSETQSCNFAQHWDEPKSTTQKSENARQLHGLREQVFLWHLKDPDRKTRFPLLFRELCYLVNSRRIKSELNYSK